MPSEAPLQLSVTSALGARLDVAESDTAVGALGFDTVVVITTVLDAGLSPCGPSATM